MTAGRWADDEDEEGPSTNFTMGPDAEGIYTAIVYKNENDTMYKVERRFKKTEITTWTNAAIQNRKDIQRFGKAAGAEGEKKNTPIKEDPIPIEVSKRVVVQTSARDEAEEKFYEDSLNIAESLNNTKKAWSEVNKAKQEAKDDAIDNKDDTKPVIDLSNLGAKAGTANYVPPSLRKAGAEPSGFGANRPQQQNQEASLRVTNLSDDVKQGDLEDLFGQVGRLQRVYLARDQATGMSRGFAFVTYWSRDDAVKAIAKLNGHGYDNLILSVQFAKPRP